MARRMRRLHLVDKTQLSPNMLRLTFAGEDLKDFPRNQESGYVKLLFSDENDRTGIKSLLPNNKLLGRSYTIRAFDSEALLLIIDFVAHGDKGPASAWAMSAKPGDVIGMQGPGPTKLINLQADWFFLAGDMSALPAIATNLEQLPQHAKGYAVIEIIHPDDQQDLKSPEGIKVIWIVNPNPSSSNSGWQTAVKDMPWLEGTPSIWVAGEFEGMRKLRRYFKQQRAVNRKQIYASSYWKIGSNARGNILAKRFDLQAL